MYKNRSQGFTLIELLVVIAIIGILSAVVLASLSTARNKGSDAAIQSNLASIQSEAEIYYGSAGANSYGSTSVSTGSCASVATTLWSDTTIQKAIVATGKVSGGTVVCNSSGTAYAISAPLLAGVGVKMFWCLDSTGSAIPTTVALSAGSTVCTP